MKNNKALLSFIAILAALGLNTDARAAAFYIQEQSISGLGTAFAGAVADTPDASTIYYNPAGMTDLGRAQTVIGTHLIIPSAEFNNNGSTVSSLPGTGGAAVALGGSTGDPFEPAVVPNAYVAFPVTADKRWWLGLGVSAPFGLTNEYDDDFFGRYDSTENALTTINVAPSAAWAVNDWLSVGAGIDIQYADAKLEGAVPSPITAGGPDPSTDGLTDLSGDDLTTGFNAGVIIKPYEGTRIGAHYRHGISHTLEGRLITQVPLDVPGLGGTFTNVGGSAELDLPSIASIGFSQKLGERWTVLGHATWFEWSNFDDIPVQLDNGTFTQDIQNYENTWAFALGARYQATDRLMLKAGLQYDQTPTVDGFRTTRIPDGDRTWVSAGATYDLNDDWTLDLAATYVDVAEEDINLSDTVPVGAASTTYNIVGETEGSVGIFSAALTYRFDSPY